MTRSTGSVRSGPRQIQIHGPADDKSLWKLPHAWEKLARAFFGPKSIDQVHEVTHHQL